MASDWQNKCGGLRWRTLPDERVEVEGRGIPSYEPGSKAIMPLAQTWANWGPLFNESAKRNGLPPSWLAAIATQETGLWAGKPKQQASITSGDGFGSIGIMQPLVSFARMLGYTPEDRYDPAKNIEMGAVYARKNVERYGRELPFIAASHNAGSPRCRAGRGAGWNMIVTDDYIGNVVRYNNAAVSVLKVGAGDGGLPTWALFGAGALVIGGGAWLAMDRGWI